MTKTKSKSQQAQEYAEKKTAAAFDYISPNIDTAENLKIPVFTGEQIKQSYLDGYTAAEQSMWRSVEDELPEDDRLVLAHFSDVDPELSYATAYHKDGAWQTPDDWYYDCKIDFWKPIIPPSLPDTNTENI